MKTWNMALVGLATLSFYANAVPVTTGSATAANAPVEVLAVPDVGGEQVVIVTNTKTGEVSVEAADGSLVPLTPVSASQIQKACYNNCWNGPVYNPYNNYYGGGGYPYAQPRRIVREGYEVKRYYRDVIETPNYGPLYQGVPNVGPLYQGGGYGYGPGY